jgi:hypothetical protein
MCLGIYNEGLVTTTTAGYLQKEAAIENIAGSLFGGGRCGMSSYRLHNELGR